MLHLTRVASIEVASTDYRLGTPAVLPNRTRGYRTPCLPPPETTGAVWCPPFRQCSCRFPIALLILSLALFRYRTALNA
ncbi:hypothetical protein PLICRDRAFT_292133 [Plicaturopsis crispa FD-325 SS-3]|nr:hypothetical protein PLICRDRAFT_292133 [Plicaturopsis crispa FD-325 SS-3]